MDIIYALVLTLWVNGAEANYPLSYSNTLEECKAKSAFTNIKRAKCVQINVMGEPSTSA